MAAAKAPEVIDNPYGLEAIWKGGDLVAKITLAILFLMSLGSWYIIITKIYEQAKMRTAGQGRPEEVLEGALGAAGRRGPEEEQPVPVHRRIRPRGHRQARRACSATST